MAVTKTKAKVPQDIVKIPGPPPLPVLGNLLDVDVNNGLESLITIGRSYGPMFSLTLGGQRELYITSRRLTEELCDETRFCKLITSGVDKLRPLTGDGLFTAHDGSHTWAVAHRILMPLFGPLRIQEMFEDMRDLSEQLCLKWSRLGPSVALDVAADFTRLTLDTIALCTMDYRFNSFYLHDKVHPFVESMFAVLLEADTQTLLPDFAIKLRQGSLAKFRKNIRKMSDICREIISHRRKNPTDSKDLLNAMLHGRDPKTGEGLSEESVIENMITFLMAGHETTSGMLSFAFYYLLENPQTLKMAQEEVDRVVGQDSLGVHHLHKLPYLDAVFRETLRLMPTAPGFFVKARGPEILGGKYAVTEDDPLFILLHLVHRDPEVWGPDAEEFRPERMLLENFEKLPPCAWKPFGNGIRGCIGRAFAWQEAQLVCAMLLRNFNFKKANPNYVLKYKQTLTVKPVGFEMHVSLRDGKRASEFLRNTQQSDHQPGSTVDSTSPITLSANGTPIRILYGSDSGTCEALAHRVAGDATRKGFLPDMVDCINTAKGNVPKDKPLVLITASYDGEPSSNAKEFVSWLEELGPGELTGAKYAVFGCGHRDWQATFHKVPRVIDRRMEAVGAERLVPMGTTDTADGTMFSDLDVWLSEKFWPELQSRYDIQPDINAAQIDIDLQVALREPPRLKMRRGFVQAIVTKAYVLSSPEVPEKRHLELRLPPDTKYRLGDHLQVLPTNHPNTVQRVLSRFKLSGDMLLTIKSSRSLGLPTNTPITASDLFAAYVELGQTASPKYLEILASHSLDDGDKAKLQLLSTTSYEHEIRKEHVSVLDILERFPTISLEISAFLNMLPQMRQRVYSLSSSPSWKLNHGTLTYSVVSPSRPNRRPVSLAPGGVGSNYLASLQPGHVAYVSLQRSKPEFRVPVTPGVPVIMISAGSGLAPFRGFVQERVLLLEKGQELSPALLFHGCRGLGLDDMYRSEMDEYEGKGAVKVFRAYSRQPEAQHKYVQDLVLAHQSEILELWNRGGLVFVCSGKKVAESVFCALGPLLFDDDKLREKTAAKSLAEWREQLPRERYVEEVFK